MKIRPLVLIIGVAVVGSLLAQEIHNSLSGSAIHTPNKIQWLPGPASLPTGARWAVLEGDPAKEGPFTMRVLLPDGFKVAPHIHPATERVTVISGTLNFGMGDKFNRSATQVLPAGTFAYWPAGMKHFAWVKGETILQVHGIGPWKIEYLDPADDPRR
jgi:quercetin dioxygenase-like cupin family protein